MQVVGHELWWKTLALDTFFYDAVNWAVSRMTYIIRVEFAALRRCFNLMTAFMLSNFRLQN